jgi:hypothetical protein
MSSNSRCVSCACVPLRWPASGRHPPGDGARAHPLRLVPPLILSPMEPSRVSRLAVSLNRVASAPRLWLRSLSTRRGSTRSLASARVQVKLAATMCAFASSLVASHRVEPKPRPTFDAPPSSESSIRLRGRPGLPVRTRRLGPHSFGRALRDRKRSRSVRAHGSLCPANAPQAPLDQGVVG